MALYKDDSASLDHLREAVTTLAETEPTARRVLGGAHPLTLGIERALENARAALRRLRAREDLLEADEADVESARKAMAAMAPGDA